MSIVNHTGGKSCHTTESDLKYCFYSLSTDFLTYLCHFSAEGMTDDSFVYRESTPMPPEREPGQPSMLPVRLFAWRRCDRMTAVHNRRIVGSVRIQVCSGRAARAGRVQPRELLPALVAAWHHVRTRDFRCYSERSVLI